MKKVVFLFCVVLVVVSCTNTENVSSTKGGNTKKTNLENKYPTDNPNNVRDRMGGEVEIK